MRGLSRLISFRKSEPIASVTPFYAIGDVHGCDALLGQLLDQLNPDVPRIYVGDYVDRGPDSAAVLRRVFTDQNATCLIGNHEIMMLAFIDAPTGNGLRWLKHGGVQTLASFGVTGVTDRSDPDEVLRARDAFVHAAGPALIDQLRTLPASYVNGNVAVVHAGADPNLPIDRQDRKTLIWGHRDFERKKRTDGVWILHGHTIVSEPKAERGRIAIDTGAYATGRLTAAHVTPHGVTFLQVHQ